MIIANIRSQQDLQGKRNTQAKMLEIEASNEADLEKRIRDYKNPNKPLAVAPEYKTNAQLQSDRLAQEKQAIVNMGELGFDYNKSADLVAWLSSSLINKLVDFNANFKGIRKELVETTNPKLINLDFLKNYLEKYFEDLDVNFGRKFSTNQVQGISATSSVDELTELLPSPEEIEQLKQYFIQTQQYLLAQPRSLTGIQNEIASEYIEPDDVRRLPEREKREYNELMRALTDQRNTIIRDADAIQDILKQMRLSVILLDLYEAIIPNTETFTLLKTSLTQQERADLIRRYMGVLRGLKILSRNGVNELIDEAEAIEEYDLPALLRISNKAVKSLAFVSNDAGVNQISKLQRDYEVLLNQSGKVGDLDKISRLNSIREGEIARGRQVLQSFLKEGDGASFRDEVAEIIGNKNPVRTTTSDPRSIGNQIDYSIEEELERYDEAVAQLGEDRAKALREQAEAKRGEAFEAQKGRLKPSGGARREKDAKEIAREQAEVEAQALAQYKQTARDYYSQFTDEIIDRYNETPDGGIIMLKHFLFDADKLAIPRNQIPKQKGKTPDNYFGELVAILDNWIERNRVAPLTIDLPFIEPTMNADYYKTNNTPFADGRATIKGVGVKPRGIGSIDPVSGYTRTGEMITKGRGNMKITIEHGGKEEHKQGGELGFKHTRVKVGKGISVKETPSYKHFGKYVIHMGHLLDKNVANFKYPSLGSIPSIKPLTISEDYKEFIIDTLENQKPNERLFTKLPNEEQRHFEKVVSGAGLIDTFKLKRNQGKTEKEEANRFNLLRGEILAGNNNEKLMKELRGLILRFMNEGRIQQKEGTSMLVELSAL